MNRADLNLIPKRVPSRKRYSALNTDSALVEANQEAAKILQCSVAGMDGIVIGDVVTVVAQRRREEGHEPYRADPQFLEVVELLFEPLKIADSVPVAVVESADVHLIDNRIFVPKGIRIYWQTALSWIMSVALGAQDKAQVYAK